MNIRLLLLFLPLLSFSQSVRIQDSQSKEPIPFVNIWIKGSQSGTTSNENGKFELALKPADTLVLSAIGYERLEIPYRSFESTVTMNRSLEQLDAVVIEKPKFEKEQTFGDLKMKKRGSSWGCGNIPWMVGSQIPFTEKYDATPFLKKLVVVTQSDIKEAKFAVRLYDIAESLYKYPLNDEPIYAIAKKGKQDTEIDLSKHHIIFPETGLTVVFEFLIIEENKHIYTATSSETGKRNKHISYEPAFRMRKPKQLNASNISYIRGSWKNKKDSNYGYYETEIALQLVMTN
jgi:hypothetical protein